MYCCYVGGDWVGQGQWLGVWIEQFEQGWIDEVEGDCFLVVVGDQQVMQQWQCGVCFWFVVWCQVCLWVVYWQVVVVVEMGQFFDQVDFQGNVEVMVWYVD